MNDLSHTARTDAEVPDVIRQFQAARDARNTDAALSTFAHDAHVADDGRDFRGTAEIRNWLATAASEFSYTRTDLGAQQTGPAEWLVRNRIEGDFPGGLVELRYRFELEGDRIADLVIAP